MGDGMRRRRLFRFGLIGETAQTRDVLLDVVRRAENSGYATFLIRDHIMAEPFGHQLAPLIALATIAASTKTLRVGTLVLANDYRHPATLAKEAATIDVLSNGRFELGLGAGFSEAEYDQIGLRLDPPGVRVERLEESVRILKGLFAHGQFSFAGKHYTVNDFDSFPKPTQRPHPPILIGASGKRMLSFAAREADIIGLQTVSTTNGAVINDPRIRLASTVEQKIEQVRLMAGERFDQIELSMVVTVIIDEQRHQAAEQLARDKGWTGISSGQVLEMPSIFIGSAERIIEDMQMRRERFGFSYLVLPDHALETAAPIVGRLAGK
jgi:probable F420-dependent oxidoreductase